MNLFVGRSDFRGQIKSYDFDLLELAVSSSMPKSSTLERYRSERPDLRYSLRLHPDVLTRGEVEHEDVGRAHQAAEILAADCVVIPSGPRFTPTSRNRRILEELAHRVRTQGRQVAWEPRGLFDTSEAQEWAEGAGALLVRDLTREPALVASTVYTRLLPFGVGQRVGQFAVEQLAERLEGASTAYVIMDGEGARGGRSQLRQWFELEEP